MKDGVCMKIMKYESELFILNYTEKDKCYIEDFMNYLNSNSKRVMDFFGLEKLSKKITINLIENKEEFDKIFTSIYNQPAYDFAIGFAKDNQIYYISFNELNNVPKHQNDTYEYYKKTIVHEFVHSCNQEFSDLWIRCLCEGLAVYLSGQQDNYISDFNITKDELFNGRINYKQYFLFVKYIIENYNHNFVLNLYKNENFAKENLDRLYDEALEYYQNKNKIK